MNSFMPPGNVRTTMEKLRSSMDKPAAKSKTKLPSRAWTKYQVIRTHKNEYGVELEDIVSDSDIDHKRVVTCIAGTLEKLGDDLKNPSLRPPHHPQGIRGISPPIYRTYDLRRWWMLTLDEITKLEEQGIEHDYSDPIFYYDKVWERMQDITPGYAPTTKMSIRPGSPITLDQVSFVTKDFVVILNRDLAKNPITQWDDSMEMLKGVGKVGGRWRSQLCATVDKSLTKTEPTILKANLQHLRCFLLRLKDASPGPYRSDYMQELIEMYDKILKSF